MNFTMSKIYFKALSQDATSEQLDIKFVIVKVYFTS
jgi:hypothetical protein